MVAPRTTHTPSGLAEAAAKAVVIAQELEYNGGSYLDDFGWALGGQLAYERGLALFATAVLDVAAATDSPGESSRACPVCGVELADTDSDVNIHYAAVHGGDRQ